MTRFKHLGPGEGLNYEWAADHTFPKVDAADTAGAYTLMEDNLKPDFALGLHRHDHHAETFYFLEGEVAFYVDGEWIRAVPGTTIHVPPGVPHACKVMNDAPAKMLMIYQPAGFDGFLAEMANFTDADFADSAKMTALEAKYDIIQMGPVPEGGPV